MQTNQIEDLLKRYTKGQCSEEEKALVERAYLTYLPDVKALNEEEIQADLAWIQSGLPKDPKRYKIKIFRLTAAAAILIILFIGLLYLRIGKNNHEVNIASTKKEQILPGTDNAILTLADGRKIVLDKNASTLFTDSSAGIKIRKTAKGELIYEVVKTEVNNETINAYNTIETPRGSQYKIILPDGTNVWLNAASSLRYPVVFSGKNRTVTLNGEGYFEVAKNKNMPFMVNSGNQTVEVLGTHFNISSYPDDIGIATTLLEGKVTVSKGKERITITPGEQVLNLPEKPLLQNTLADAGEKIAWKNGIFLFNHEDLHSIMNKISRWYDIDVEYKNDFKAQYYSGTISKFGNVTDILKIMELTRSVKFKIEGRRIIVMK